METAAAAEIYGYFPFLKEIDTGILSPKKIPAGTLAFLEGDNCANIALVTGGVIRVAKIGANGREINLYRVTPGESCVLLLTSALSGTGYPATAIVEEDAEVVMVPTGKFKEWMNTFPGVRDFAYGLLAKRLMAVMVLIEEITFRKVDERLAELILKQAARGKDTLQTTHDELAVELGTAREVVSRVLKEFEKEKAIELARGKIKITAAGILQKKFTKCD
jgi:CRP/FNR family transcriptional regulator